MRRLLSVIALFAFGCVHRAEPVSGVVLASQVRAADGTLVGVGGETSKGKFLCSPEMTLGSHIPTQVCRYVDDNQDTVVHRIETRDAMHAFETGTCVPSGPTGAQCNTPVGR